MGISLQHMQEDSQVFEGKSILSPCSLSPILTDLYSSGEIE